MRRIVVGVDGSDPSVAALRWSIGLARTTGARVEAVVVAVQLPLAAPMGVLVAEGPDVLEQAEKALRHTLEEVEHEGVELDSVVQDGQTAGVLLGIAEAADVLVLGTHGHGALEAALLGSVSRQVVTHATVPTVLVPSAPDRLGRFVVGVDGSEESLHALRWASDLAREVGAELEVVTAYHHTPVGVGSPWIAPVPTIGAREMQEAAADVLDAAVDKADAHDVVVERTVAEGSAAARLRDRAGDADLLVVGSRGHGGFAGLLLGSVSRRCLTHPVCPVAVVPSH